MPGIESVCAARISGRNSCRTNFAAGGLTLFRIISPDGDCLALSETVQDVVEIVRHGRPGRYQVDGAGPYTLSSGQSSRNWGAVTRFPAETSRSIIIRGQGNPNPRTSVWPARACLIRQETEDGQSDNLGPAPVTNLYFATT